MGVGIVLINNDYDIEYALRKHSLMVFRLAYAKTGNASDAEDIVQEVFLTLIRKNPVFDSEEDRKAWLIRVTINRSNSLWRTAWRKRVHLWGIREAYHEEPEHDTGLRDAISRLSSDDRVLIHLHYFEGFKIEEIAEMIRCPSSTIRSRLYRARNKLRRLIIEEKQK